MKPGWAQDFPLSGRHQKPPTTIGLLLSQTSGHLESY